MMVNLKVLQVIVACSVLILSQQQQTECRRNKTSVSRNKTTSHDNRTDSDIGASRVSGGLAGGIMPPFLGTLWAPQSNGSDGKFAGAMIGMGGDHFIAHQRSHAHVQETDVPIASELATQFLPDMHQPAKHIMPGPASFDAANHNPPLEASSIKSVNTDLGGGFGLYKVQKDFAKDNPLNFAAPKLEHDKNEFGGTGCRAHGWSDTNSRWMPGSRSGEGEDDREGERRYVTFPVMKTSGPCKSGHCTLSSDPHTSTCHKMGDHGMPVLCGQEEKLTYLIKPSPGTDGCTNMYEAFHVPHMIDQLKSVPGLNLR